MPASRAERLAERVAEAGLDSLLVGDLVRPGDSTGDAASDIRWLTGFTGTSGFAVVGPAVRTFLTDFRYSERAAKEVGDEFDRVTIEGRLLSELARRMSGRVGFDDAATSVRSFEKLRDELGSGAELVPVRGMLADLRRCKDATEIEAVAAASQLADEVFMWLAESGLAGRTEAELASAIATRMRENGAEPSFPSIVAGGPNGAQPHAEPGDRQIEKGELVVVDLGAKLDGYCSDGTRTYATGDPGAEATEVYELVLAAQEAALDVIRAGLAGAEADAVARGMIEAGGHGDRFGHGLGHGVGLEVHEPPRLGKTSEDVLAEGDVVSVEPGVYLPGRFGVRIEDLVVVTGEGHRNLSGTTKALTITG